MVGGEGVNCGGDHAQPANNNVNKKPAFSARLMQMKFMQRGAERRAQAAEAKAAKAKEQVRKERTRSF